jgi:hypothetical protein
MQSIKGTYHRVQKSTVGRYFRSAESLVQKRKGGGDLAGPNFIRLQYEILALRLDPIAGDIKAMP